MSNITQIPDIVKLPFETIQEQFAGDWSDLALELLGEPTKREKRGKEWRYLCPLHSETQPSFSFNVEKGVFYCFGCNEQGDAIDLWAKIRHCNKAEAALEIAQIFGIDVERAEGKPPHLTLAAYAAAKKLKPALLREWGLRDSEQGLAIPYLDQEGKEVAVRIRVAMRGPDRFRWRPGDKPCLYGLWRLKDYPRDRLYLVEGESDCHTLWQAGLPALGLPGKTIFRAEWAEPLRSFAEIIILEEPAARFEVLKIAQAIRALKNGPKVFALRLSVKDPSELWRRNPDPEAFKASLEQAEVEKEPLDFSIPRVRAEWLCYSQEPIYYHGESLRLPYPYIWERGRLIQLEPTARELKRSEIAPRLLIIGGRYRDERGRVWTEVAWQQDEEKVGWGSRLIERKEALDKKTLLELARWGAPVTSESASRLVKFLEAFEEWNREALKPKLASTHMGWQRYQASPLFLVGERAIGGDCKLIAIGEEEQRLIEAYKPRGREEEWRRLWEALPSPQARFIAAAHLAAPLVRPLGERSSLLYLYGESLIGKTAILHLGLAAWGEPAELIGSAFSTAVGLERRSALFSDLPLAIDERQAATSEQALDMFTYMLAGGRGKERGQKEGGLQAVAQWRTLALMTGEQDLTEAPWMGLENRTIQLYLPRLLSEELAREIYSVTSKNYGLIGPKCIEKVIAEGIPALSSRKARLEKELEGAHLSGGKLALIAIVGVAEWLLWEVLGLNSDEAFARTLSDIGVIISTLGAEPKESLAERAWDFIRSKVTEFQADLKARGATGQDERVFTDEELGEELVYILPSLFEKWLKEGGFTKKRVLRDWDSKGWIVTKQEGGEKRYTILKRSPGSWEKRNRYYCLRLSAMDAEIRNVTTSEKGQNVG